MSETMVLIQKVLKMAHDEYEFSYDEQINLWVEFLKAEAELSFEVKRLMKEHGVSRPEAIKLAFELRPQTLKALIKRVSLAKYYQRHPGEE